MEPFWHPLSTILFADPVCWASVAVLRMFLRPGAVLTLRYAGDRMWPALRDGGSFEVDAADPATAARGEAWLVARDGVPDLLRIVSVEADRCRLAGDADPTPVALERAALLGRARLPPAHPGSGRRALRRLAIDLGEACRGRPEASGGDPARTVLDKYDAQAPFYAKGGARIDAGLMVRLRAAVAPPADVLVVGSGAGNECVALWREGYRVRGIDFSPAMVGQARQVAHGEGAGVEFAIADLRSLGLEPRSLDLVLFTYDVYSFVPGARARIEALRALRAALRPSGALFLSARRRTSSYQALVLTVQWLAGRGRDRGEWGWTHTRWIGQDGSLRRSFVHVFDPGVLDREVRAAGFDYVEPWLAGHARLGATGRGTGTAMMPGRDHRGPVGPAERSGPA